MKSFVKVIIAILIIGFGIYAYDMYSGFKVTTFVNSIVEDEKIEAPDDSENESTDTLSLDTIIYNRLDDSEKAMYDTIYTAISTHRSKAYLKDFPGSENAFRIVKLVAGDHPEFFYFTGRCIYYGNGIVEFKYDYTKQEAEEIQRKIDKAVDGILPKLQAEKSPYQRSLAAFEWIINNTTYDSENLDKVGEIASISSIEGVFVNHKAVCGGYARAYQYLLHRLEIPALFISGDALQGDKTERHAWICQELGGEYYFSDPTWCDAYEMAFPKSFVSHIYFCINSAQLEKSHRLDEQYEFIKTDAEKYNYFVKEGYAFDEYSVTQIRTAVKESLTQNKTGVELYFPNDYVYKNAKVQLIDNSDIYIILKSIDLFSIKIDTSRISYSVNDNQNVIMIAFKEK